jgi:hypothetical protein
MLWIRIRSDLDYFLADLQIGVQCLRIRIRAHAFQLNVKLNQSFSRKFQYTIQNIEKYDTSLSKTM